MLPNYFSFQQFQLSTLGFRRILQGISEIGCTFKQQKDTLIKQLITKSVWLQIQSFFCWMTHTHWLNPACNTYLSQNSLSPNFKVLGRASSETKRRSKNGCKSEERWLCIRMHAQIRKHLFVRNSGNWNNTNGFLRFPSGISKDWLRNFSSSAYPKSACYVMSISQYLESHINY